MMIDPREQIKMALFDAFSECNSLCKQDMTAPSGQSSARISIRRIESCLYRLDDLSIKMREFIKQSEGSNSGLKKEASREKKAGSLDVQVGGTHYKNKKIQPAEYIHANVLGFLEGCVVKRMTRWRDKPASNRFEDLEKAKHEIDLLIELEKRTGGNS